VGVTRAQDNKLAKDDDPRSRQLLIGLSILGVLILLVPAFYIVWHFVPGLFGEWLGVIAGVMSTPFLLEIFFIILGLIIVVGINQLRQRREGDEFVYLEQIEDPSAPADIPDHSKFAIYGKRPLEGVQPSRIDDIEGAIEIRDHDQAAEWLAELGDDELKRPEVLALRLRLARETGKNDLAMRIESEINASGRSS